jgi:hypothetical protein
MSRFIPERPVQAAPPRPMVVLLTIAAAAWPSFHVSAEPEMEADAVMDATLRLYPTFQLAGWKRDRMKATREPAKGWRKVWKIERVKP